MAEVKTVEREQEQAQGPQTAEGAESLSGIMWQRSKQWADRDFLHKKEGQGWRAIKWSEFARDVSDLARALIAYGISSGDRVSVLSNTRYEWTVCDYAMLSVGAITVPIYQTSSAAEIEYVLNDSGARLIFFEDAEQYEKLKKVMGSIGALERLVQIEGEPPAEEGWMGIDAFKELSKGATEKDVQERSSRVSLDDVATYIYTSGTTGPPKGCIITNRNFISCGRSVLDAAPGMFTVNDSTLLFLPLAHGFARMVQFVAVDTGMKVYYGNIKDLMNELQTSKPTFFISVPRMFEKAYTGVQSKAASSKVGELVFKLATAIAKALSKAKQEHKGTPLQLIVPQLVADKLIYSKVRQALGGNVKYAISGGAPLAVNVAHFFNAAGITILEGYGLTETAPATNCNTPDKYKIGTVGRALAVNEVKIADDGEVLMRGDNIFKGYYGDEQKTAEALRDGWFHSGDVGEIDGDGFLKITGRIKDLIITAGGKNITPTLIEDKLKESRYISQAVCIGDARPYLVALITLDPDETKGMDRATVERLVAEHIEQSNKHFGRVEQIKTYKVLDRDFSIDDGEITPTLKVKRAKIQERYSDVIEGLYTS